MESVFVSYCFDTCELTSFELEVTLAVGRSVDPEGETLVAVVCNPVASGEALAAAVAVCAVVLVLSGLTVLDENIKSAKVMRKEEELSKFWKRRLR